MSVSRRLTYSADCARAVSVLRAASSYAAAVMVLTEPPPDNPAKMRAHPGREWLVVLSGTATLLLGDRRFRVETNRAAEFPTMMPHAIGAEGRPCEVMFIFDRDARRGHRENDDSEDNGS